MSNEVKDVILTGDTSDAVLANMIEITVDAIVTGRPLFTNPLTEPDFYRKHFSKWVQEGVNEAKKTVKK